MTTRVLRSALLMEKTAAPELEDNEDSRGPSPVKLYPDPPERAGTARTLDAPQGEPPYPDPAHVSDGAWNEFLANKPKMVDNIFDRFSQAAQEAKAHIRQNFQTKDYESRNALLRKYASEGSIPDGDTLHEKVNKICR